MILTLDFQYAASIEKVWAALTDSNKLAKWIMDNDFRPVVGHRFQFRTQPSEWWNGIIDGEVLIVDEPNKLSYNWVSAGKNTTVTWTLTHEEGTTYLHLEQTGFEDDEEQYFNGAKHGWTNMFEALKKVLEQ